MSSGFLYEEEISPRSSVSPGDKVLKRILVMIGVILLVELIWLFGVSPCMPLAKVEVSGVSGIDEGAVLALAGIGNHSSYMTVNAQAAERALLVLPAIRSARVIKHFPNRVELILEPRRAAAMAFVEEGRRMFPALIDGDGMIFSVGREGFREREALPVISGLMLERVFPGMKLPRIYSSLFTELETLTREAPELLAAISEIRINGRNYDGYDLTVYPVHGGVKVRMGQDINEETLRYMLLMLDVLSARSRSIEEIDFRTGTASYKIKEAYSG
ncbi:MAG: FtsQ-type POTRA domain-containing protein [Spirochaetaceae bacterium]|jgi:cell division protein FtsQ|nr:FtsQ-type POTRA domain-containing protein [Spirochaetaceae bacterium]